MTGVSFEYGVSGTTRNMQGFELEPGSPDVTCTSASKYPWYGSWLPSAHSMFSNSPIALTEISFRC